MKTLLRIATAVLCTILLSGCFIQSFCPFYTENMAIEMPGIAGKWLLVKKGNEDVSQKYPEPWVFGEDEITTFERSVRSVLNARYFKAKDLTFVDLSPSARNNDKDLNECLKFHLIPVHSVCKVALTDNALELTPLDRKWVHQMFQEDKIPLSHVVVEGQGEHIVLASPPEELATFLRNHGSDTNAFSAKASYTFRRMKEKESTRKARRSKGA